MSDPTTPQRYQLERIAQGDNVLLEALERLFDRVGTEIDGDQVAAVLGAAVAAGQIAAARAVAQTAQNLASFPAQVPASQESAIPFHRPEDLAKNYIDFRIAPSSDEERRAKWSGNTLTIGLLNDVTLRVGQDVHVYGLNSSGVTINKGQAVMVTGASAGAVTIARAVANGTVRSSFMLGLAAQDIANGASGYVTTLGAVDFDTTGLAAGNLVYFNASTAGALTTTRPAAPNLRTPRGVVLATGASGRVLCINGEDARINDAQDVNTTGIADDDFLTWDTATSTWITKGLSDFDLVDIGDVTGTGLANGDFLTWSASGQNWYGSGPGDINLRDLADVSNASPSAGQYLGWSGSQWAPTTLPAVPGGATGSFTADGGETITVTDGRIISIV